MNQDIIIGLGANLPGLGGQTPLETCQQALMLLRENDVAPVAVSPVYESEPFPPSDQPWYINAVTLVKTDFYPKDLLGVLLKVEEKLGRRRGEKNDPRIIDLDLIDYAGAVLPGMAAWLHHAETDAENTFFLPHIRAHQRIFVLKPLVDLCPDWHHPVLGRSAGELLDEMSSEGKIRQAKGHLEIS